jgi:hypothetical protein
MTIKRKKGQHGGARPGAGRPALVKNPHSLRVSVERDEYEALQKIAERSGKSVAEIVRDSIRSFLRRRKR